MAQTETENINNDKVAEILSIAQKRFGAYGFKKTTMNEIANELEMSKAALYYYYPDKESIYKAVVEKEIATFTSILNEKLSFTNNPVELIEIYAEYRTEFIRSQLNLARLRMEEVSSLLKIISELKLTFRDLELARIIGFFQEGVNQGIFQISDCDSLANLFLDTLKGLSMVFRKNREISYISDEDYLKLKQQIQQIVQIFIKGISKN